MARRSRRSRRGRGASPSTTAPSVPGGFPLTGAGAGLESPPTAAASASSIFGGAGVSFFGPNGHQAAEQSRTRGYVYFPQLDTRREVNTLTRVEILRKARWLVANYGLPKRLVFGLSRLVCGTGLTPQATTKDAEWNKLAASAFQARAGSRFVWDVGNRYDFRTSQLALKAFAYRDGDSSAILTKSDLGLARFAFYEGHQIGPGFGRSAADDAVDRWFDGVRVDRFNAPQRYRYLLDEDKTKDVPADNVVFMARYDSAGKTRGLSLLSHAVNHLLDVAEITGYIKQGVKLANQFGYWVEKEKGTTTKGATSSVAGKRTTVETGAGGLTLERVLGGGAIPDLAPGESLKFSNSSHPHPNNLTLTDYLIRDVAWGAGMSPEVIWNIAALGGANTRFVLADAQGWIENEQADLARTYLSRAWIYTIALEVASGRLRECRDPEWWQHAWITPPRLTVDFGKDGKLYLEQLKSGALTFKRLYGWQGLDHEPELLQWLDELAFLKKEGEARGLSWNEIQAARGFNVATNPDDPTKSAEENNAERDDSAAADDDANAEALTERIQELATRDPAEARRLLNRFGHLSDPSAGIITP